MAPDNIPPYSQWAYNSFKHGDAQRPLYAFQSEEAIQQYLLGWEIASRECFAEGAVAAAQDVFMTCQSTNTYREGSPAWNAWASGYQWQKNRP